ncbi:MAG: hypothetical protein PUH17_07095, partial [Fusobacterium mortiferum]|nr:hypothetical protein [Fusobacterium mortiferum]
QKEGLIFFYDAQIEQDQTSDDHHNISYGKRRQPSLIKQVSHKRGKETFHNLILSVLHMAQLVQQREEMKHHSYK